MKTSHFVFAMIAVAMTFAIFTVGDFQGSEAYRVGAAFGRSVGMIAIGTFFGVVAWIPVRAFKGVERSPDFKLFALSGTALTACFLLLPYLFG